MDEHKGFGGYLKILREKARMTQPELAKALGVQTQTVWRWEHGEREPSLDIVKKLCGILNCTESELLNGSDTNVVKVVLSWDWQQYEEGGIDMTGNEFDVFLGKNGEIGLKGSGKLTSREALEEFLANVRLQAEIALDAHVRRGAIQGA